MFKYTYQIQKVDTQRHTTDDTFWGGWNKRIGTVSDKCHWGFELDLGVSNLTLFPFTRTQAV